MRNNTIKFVFERMVNQMDKVELKFTWKEKEYFAVIKHSSNGYYRVKLYDSDKLLRKQLNKDDEGSYYYLEGVETMIRRTMWKYNAKQELLDIK